MRDYKYNTYNNSTTTKGHLGHRKCSNRYIWVRAYHGQDLLDEVDRGAKVDAFRVGGFKVHSIILNADIFICGIVHGISR